VIQESVSLKYEPVSVEVESSTDVAQLSTFSNKLRGVNHTIGAEEEVAMQLRKLPWVHPNSAI